MAVREPSVKSGLGMGESGEEPVEERSEGIDLVVRQLVNEEAADCVHMVWCGGVDGGTAGGGQPDHGPSGIVGTVLSCDEAPLFHPAELVGDSAAVPAGQTTEVPGSDDVGCFGERHQQGVVRSGESGVAHELAVEGVSQLALQVAVGLPEVRFPFIEPAGFSQRLFA